MKLFPKSFERCHLSEKRRHPETFPVFYQRVVFKQSLTFAFGKMGFLFCVQRLQSRSDHAFFQECGSFTKPF
ncbi:hypothetical protein FYB92_03555 [Novacetimonas sp. GS1]